MPYLSVVSKQVSKQALVSKRAKVEGKEREIVRGPIAIKKSLYEECIYNYFIGRINVQAQQTDPQNKLP